MAGVFVSYRREDSRHAAGRLVDRLVAGLGRDRLFMDVDSIEPGLDFVKVLNEQVANCDVLLALIGRNWLDARDASGARRIDDPHDFVRIEIEAALNRDVRVVPVLLDGAELPSPQALPESLRPLLRRHALRLTHERFAAEADALAESLKRTVASPAATTSASGRSGQPAPFMAASPSAHTADATPEAGRDGAVAPSMSQLLLAALVLGAIGATGGALAYGPFLSSGLSVGTNTVPYVPAIISAVTVAAGLAIWSKAKAGRIVMAALIAGAGWFAADTAGTFLLTAENQQTTAPELLLWSIATTIAPIAAVCFASPEARRNGRWMLVALIVGCLTGLAFYVPPGSVAFFASPVSGAIAIGPLMACIGYAIASHRARE